MNPFTENEEFKWSKKCKRAPHYVLKSLKVKKKTVKQSVCNANHVFIIQFSPKFHIIDVLKSDLPHFLNTDIFTVELTRRGDP